MNPAVPLLPVLMTLTAFACLTPAHCQAAELKPASCTVVTEYIPSLCPNTLTKIAGLTVEKTPAPTGVPQAGEADCRAFHLSPRQARRFFQSAKITDEANAHHTLDWSACNANGTVIFANGQRAQWSINLMRTGRLVFENGQKIFMFCPDCHYQPFSW